MERIIAFFFLILVAPFLFILFLLLKITSKGPLIFKQKRMGKDRKVFSIYKIRTMVEDAERLKTNIEYLNEADGPVFKIKNDPRFTSIGKYLAYTGLDEILQLINIIKGEMSFVGPRPLPVDEALHVPPQYHERFSIKPGITSLWVIRGTHSLSFNQWMESDLEYVEKKNWFFDMSILITTILFVTKWTTHNIFLFFFPLVLLFYAITPYSAWWFQIFSFLSIFLFLGLDFHRKPSIYLVFLSIFLFISTLYSINKVSAVPYFFSYILIFLIASTFIADEKRTLIKSYIIGTVIIGILSALYSLSQILFGSIPGALTFLDKDTNLIIPYYGYAFYAVFLIATFPFILEKYLKEKLKVWFVVFIAFLTFILLSFSKMAIIVGFIELIMVFALHNHLKKDKTIMKMIFVSILMLLLSLTLIYIVLPKNAWLQKKIFKPSVVSRLEYFQQDLIIFKNSPLDRILLGYGMDNFFELSNRFQSQPSLWTSSAHNYFIQFFIENGLISTIILIIFLGSVFIKNIKKYSVPEKVVLVSLVIYSFGSTYDLKVIPVLLLFFVLLYKEPQSDMHMVKGRGEGFFSLGSSGWIGLLTVVILSFFWIKYLYVYTNFFITNKSEINTIDHFPYDSAFWTFLADRYGSDTAGLLRLDNKLQQYSQVNADLYKYIILKLYQNKAYCDVVNLSQKYLSDIPLDLDMQNYFMDSVSKCHGLQTDELGNFFQKIKPQYNLPDTTLFKMKNFLHFIAVYYYTQGNYSEYQVWFEKAWNFEVNNNNNYWKNEIFDNAFSAFPINSPFIIKIGMRNKNDLAGIALFGQLPHEGSWWEGAKKIFIGLRKEGRVFHVDAIDGRSSDSHILLDKILDENIKALNIYFDKDGKYLKITDENNKVISEIDINRETDNSFPDGLFPESKFYLSYTVSPYSYLSIDKFMILPLER